MTLSRTTSDAEDLMIEVLTQMDKPLTLTEIVKEIHKVSPNVLTGKSPRNSLYSIIYRREKRRIETGVPTLFDTFTERRDVLYTLRNFNFGNDNV
jgi:hypothetical protein